MQQDGWWWWREPILSTHALCSLGEKGREGSLQQTSRFQTCEICVCVGGGVQFSVLPLRFSGEPGPERGMNSRISSERRTNSCQSFPPDIRNGMTHSIACDKPVSEPCRTSQASSRKPTFPRPNLTARGVTRSSHCTRLLSLASRTNVHVTLTPEVTLARLKSRDCGGAADPLTHC